MKAIITEKHPASENRGAYFSAHDLDGNYSELSENELPTVNTNFDFHAAVAKKLCQKMNWHGVLGAGELEGGRHAFVWSDSFLINV